MKKRKHAVFDKLLLIMIILLTLFVLLIGYLIIQSDNTKLDTTYYRVVSEKIGKEFRVVQLSDLHNTKFGENNQDLIREIQDLKPDLILMTGDMVNDDDEDITVVLNLCGELIKTAPVYYSLGNHEGTMMYGEDRTNIPLDRELAELGAVILYNNSKIVSVKGNEINLGAVASSANDFEWLSKSFIEDYVKDDSFKLLMSHYPSLYIEKRNCLYDADIDLALAGHYHGGQIRLPFLGGIYHPDTGLFPKYEGGKYPLKSGTLIVSRGLGNHESIPRINNRPELVVVDISHQ